jgi:hypothetical protein
MTRITSVDQALLLLRSHLQRTERSRRPSHRNVASPDRRTALQRVSEMASDGQTSEDDLQRALIAGLLLDELGGVEDDPRFQETVTRVKDAILAGTESRSALDRALSQLTGARRRR